MARALICLLLVAGTYARGTGRVSEGEAVKIVDENMSENQADNGMSVNDRKGKFFSVFQIVKFKNGKCTTSTGDDGTCYTEAECTAAGGVASGACASSFGVCCLFVANTCGSMVDQNNAYIQSPSYPGASPAGMCMFEIKKCDSDICQYKLTFEDVMLSGPMMGDCTNDTLMISSIDGANTFPPSLCGDLTGQEVYLTVKAQTGASKVVFNIASTATMSRYKIKVEQIACTDTALLAPPGCLTYDMNLSGTFTSFNYASGAGEIINNQKFSHCIKYQDGYCDVSFTSTTFDIGTSGDAADSVTIGSSVQTGNAFGTSGMVNLNFTGPYVFPVCTDDSNTAMLGGYEISYLLLPC